MCDQKRKRRRRKLSVRLLALLLLLSWQWFGDRAQTIAIANPNQKGEQAMTFTISSSAFAANGKIPVLHTCDGQDISPPLRWNGLPPSCESLALIVEDPDAPDPAAPRMIWVHWVLYNIPAKITGLEQGAGHSLPQGILEGINNWQRTGYGGPCPPIGTHRYFFKLYALDVVLPDLGKPDKKKLLNAMKGHVLAQVELIGTYHR